MDRFVERDEIIDLRRDESVTEMTLASRADDGVINVPPVNHHTERMTSVRGFNSDRFREEFCSEDLTRKPSRAG